MNNNKSDGSGKLVTWFSKVLRWGIGAAIIVSGIVHYNTNAWPVIAFGVVVFITGFLKPTRCIGGCFVDQRPGTR
jgi:hypothetical protein